MNIESCFQLGEVAKTHGIKGEVQLYLDVDDPTYYSNIKSLFLNINNKLIPFFISNISISGNIAYIKFEDVNSIEDAGLLKNAEAFLPVEALPPLTEGQFFFHELIGYEIVDIQLGNLGVVEDIISLPQHEILIFRHQNKEVLAPLNDDVIQNIDKEGKVLHIQLPEGLLDIYLEA